MLRSYTMGLEVFIWAIIGGIFVAILSGGAVYYTSDSTMPSKKQISRDFLIGAAVTGLLYPMIPESLEEIKDVISSTAGELQSMSASPGLKSDPGVQVGPANF